MFDNLSAMRARIAIRVWAAFAAAWADIARAALLGSPELAAILTHRARPVRRSFALAMLSDDARELVNDRARRRQAIAMRAHERGYRFAIGSGPDTRAIDVCGGCGSPVEPGDDGPCCAGAVIEQAVCWRVEPWAPSWTAEDEARWRRTAEAGRITSGEPQTRVA